MAMPFYASDSENERGQMVERVDRLEAHKNERYDHQIKAKMHEGLATKYFLPRARIAQGREPKLGGHPERRSPGKPFVSNWSRKPPPPRK
jgi:hypothetical protein